MITDDERREVAARLRDSWYKTWHGESMLHRLFDQLGMDPHVKTFGKFRYYKALALRLADLIEPEPERTCTVVCYPDDQPLYYETCSKCGTILAKKKPGDRHSQTANYCPNCGAKVVGRWISQQ